MKKNLLHNLKSDKTAEWCSKISFLMIELYFLDILLLGTGILTRIGIFSTRIIFFGLAGLFSLPLLIRDFRKLIKQKYVICVILFMIWVAISMVRGIQNGNRLDIIKTDVFGFLNFCILPTVLCVLCNEKRKYGLINVIIAVCVIMATVTVVLSFFAFFPYQKEIYRLLEKSGIVAITVMDGAAARVFCHTASRYFCVAYLLILAYLIDEENRIKTIVGQILMAILIVGIFLSYSRALYAGSVLAVVAVFAVYAVFKRSQLIRMTRLALISCVLAVVMIGVLSAAQSENLFKPAVYRVLLSVSYESELPAELTGPTNLATEPTGPSEDATRPLDENEPGTEIKPGDFGVGQDEIWNLDIRQIKVDHLSKSIKKNPIFGNGLGAAIDIIDGYVEYTYLDIINKMGFVGLFLFFTPFIGFVYDIVVHGKKERSGHPGLNSMMIALFGGMVYFLFTSWFNPCMNTTVGISCYVLTMVFMSKKYHSQA